MSALAVTGGVAAGLVAFYVPSTLGPTFGDAGYMNPVTGWVPPKTPWVVRNLPTLAVAGALLYLGSRARPGTFMRGMAYGTIAAPVSLGAALLVARP